MVKNKFPTLTRYGRTPLEDLELANKAYVDAAGGGEVNTASNVGGETGESFKAKVGVDLEFKTIGSADSTVVITNNASSIDLSALGASMTPAAEGNSTPISPTITNSLGDGAKIYVPSFDLPTDFEFFMITGIEWKNGGVVAGTIACGVDTIDAYPPVLLQTENVAWGDEVSQSGTNAVQRNSAVHSRLILKGTKLSMWVAPSGNTAQFESTSSSSENQTRTSVYATTLKIPHIDVTAWNADTRRFYGKVYYKGLGKAI